MNPLVNHELSKKEGGIHCALIPYRSTHTVHKKIPNKAGIEKTNRKISIAD
jgi:hypothetical protein